jgi:hypothetical protein
MTKSIDMLLLRTTRIVYKKGVIKKELASGNK